MPLPDVLHLLRRANSRKGDIARGLATDSKRSFWALADQGVVSLGNFGVLFLLGAYFNHIDNLKDLGSFGILLELMIFLNGIQAALVIYPLTVRGSLLERNELGKMSGVSLAMTLLAWPMLAGAVVLTSVVAGIGVATGVWAAVAMGCWQVQELMRRSLMAHVRFSAATFGDALSCVGQLVLIGFLAASAKLTLVGAFQVMALAWATAAIVQAIQVRPRGFSLRAVVGHARECWSIGQWVLFGNLSNLVTGPLFIWNFAFWAGKELLGIYSVLTNLLRLVNPLSFGIATVIMPNASRAMQERGPAGARNVMYRFGLLGALMLMPYLGTLLIAPRFSIVSVYNAADAAKLLPYAAAVQISAVTAGVLYAATVTGAMLNAVQRSRWTFISNLLAAATTLLVALPLAAFWGIEGATLGAAVAGAVQLAGHVYFIRKLSDDTVPMMRQADPVAQAA